MQTFDNELLALNDMEGVQTILRVLCRITSMRIALVAHIAEETWTACAVLDEANFGLNVGDQLPFQSTY